MRSAAGIGTADPNAVSADPADGVLPLAGRERTRRIAVACIAVAIAAPLPPPELFSSPGATVVLAVSSLLVGGQLEDLGVALSSPAAANPAIGWLLNVAAATTWSWNDLTAVLLAGAPGAG